MNEIQTIDSVSGKYMLMKHGGIIINDLRENQVKQLWIAGVMTVEDALSDDGGQTWHSCADIILYPDGKSHNQRLEDQRVKQKEIDYKQQEATYSAMTAGFVVAVIALLLVITVLTAP
jgi:hypothetical protein